MQSVQQNLIYRLASILPIIASCYATACRISMCVRKLAHACAGFRTTIARSITKGYAQRMDQPARIMVQIRYIPGDPQPGLALLADTLVMMAASETLNEAFRIAQQINTADLHLHSRQRTVSKAADRLRSQLNSISQQFGEAA